MKPEQVQVLIGADVPTALITSEVRKGAAGLPYASKTPLGWTLVGVYEDGASTPCFVRHLRPKICIDSDLDGIVKQFWETESSGTENINEESMSVHDRKILKVLDDKTNFSNGHYYVPMLWKTEEPLPDSLPVASKRLSFLMKKFERDQSYFEMYKKIWMFMLKRVMLENFQLTKSMRKLRRFGTYHTTVSSMRTSLVK